MARTCLWKWLVLAQPPALVLVLALATRRVVLAVRDAVVLAPRGACGVVCWRGVHGRAPCVGPVRAAAVCRSAVRPLAEAVACALCVLHRPCLRLLASTESVVLMHGAVLVLR